MMSHRHSLALTFVALLLFLVGVHAQFACTLTNKDESTCLDSQDDGGSGYCVWCNLSGLGFCLNENQAEAMEQSLPGVQCERHDDNNDDDKTPNNDDAPPPPPSDDSIPDDFWTCLENKNTKTCLEADCTWCDSKDYGFGLCMTGPTAKSAEESEFFKCTEPPAPPALGETALRGSMGVVSPLVVEDPADPSCLKAFLQDPTEESCKAATDSDGAPCEFCTYPSMQIQICLNQEQAEIGEQTIGLDCGKSAALDNVNDPTDPTCLEAYIQDQTADACQAAVDSDGAPCEYCTLYNGQLQLCLNGEQAERGQRFIADMDCSSVGGRTPASIQITSNVEDPYDPTCVLAYLSSPSQDACVETMDADGSPCEYCTLPGSSLQLCLNKDQAQAGSAVGIECSSLIRSEDDVDVEAAVQIEANPMDTSCLMAFINARGTMTPDECTNATDNDGAPCEFCFFSEVPGSPLCLTSLQAEMASQVAGDVLQCGGGGNSVATVESSKEELVVDPYDPTCALAFLQDPTSLSCTETNDADGNGCEFCTLQSMNLCLNQDQAEIATSIGVECAGKETSFDDDIDGEEIIMEDTNLDFPLDPTCLAAGMGSNDAKDVCITTLDRDGNSCVWCNAAGVYGLCLSAEAAEMSKGYLDCDVPAALQTAALAMS